MVFEVELLGFDKDPSWMQCDAEEKLRQGVALKDQGNGLFKEVGGLKVEGRGEWAVHGGGWVEG